jgi:hypothetical protein
LLPSVLARLESSEADRILMRQAFLNEQFADVLAGWLMANRLSAPGNYTRQFKARVESGESPETAAEEVVNRVAGDGND